MPQKTTGQPSEMQHLLATTLPDQASASEHADFARGIRLLANLVSDVVSQARNDGQGKNNE